MKLFKFRFETIKSLSEQKLKLIESKLHNIFLEISSKNRELYSYLNAISKTKSDLKTVLSGQLDVNAIGLYSLIIGNAERILAQVLEEIKVLEGKKEEIITEYMKLNSERKALEKLRSKLWSKYMMEYTKYENLEVSDTNYFNKISKWE